MPHILMGIYTFYTINTCSGLYIPLSEEKRGRKRGDRPEWNSDGIGSRYFSIANNSRIANALKQALKLQMADITNEYSIPVRVKKVFKEYTPAQTFYPDESGVIRVRVKETERLEIHKRPTVAPGKDKGKSGKIITKGL